MKKLILILILATAVNSLSAQTVKTNYAVQSFVKSDNYSYVYSVKFKKSKREKVNKLIVSELGNSNIKRNTTSTWEGEGYSVALTSSKILITIDREEASKATQSQIINLGNKVSDALGGGAYGPRTPTPPTPPSRD